MPAALPLGPGDLRLDRRALILLVHDLRFAKSVNSFRLRQQFGVAMLGVLVAVLGLGVALHFFVTRRIEHLHGTMARFAAGEPVEKEPMPDRQTSGRNLSPVPALYGHRRDDQPRDHRPAAGRVCPSGKRGALPVGDASLADRYGAGGNRWSIPGGEPRSVRDCRLHQRRAAGDEIQGSDPPRRPARRRARDDPTAESRDRHPSDRQALLPQRRPRGVDTAQLLDRQRRGRSGRIFVTQVQDITESRRADQELRRVNRSLRTISNCNQVLVHATDESELLHQLCKVIVGDGGYRMAWVGLLDPDAEQVVASRGARRFRRRLPRTADHVVARRGRWSDGGRYSQRAPRRLS